MQPQVILAALLVDLLGTWQKRKKKSHIYIRISIGSRMLTSTKLDVVGNYKNGKQKRGLTFFQFEQQKRF